jgi:hypothetical protein
MVMADSAIAGTDVSGIPSAANDAGMPSLRHRSRRWRTPARAVSSAEAWRGSPRAIDRRRQVEAQHVREQQRVGQPVGDAELAPQRVRQRVDRAGVDRPEAHAAVQAAERDGAAGGQVVALERRPLQVRGDEPDTGQRVRVHQRVGEAVGERLDAVGQRVDAGRGGQGRRDVAGQFRVDVRGVGHEVRADDALLQLLGLVEQDRVGGHLAAGAGGRGDAGQEAGPGADAADAETVAHVPRLAHQRCDKLGDVHDAAAAEADHRVTPRVGRGGAGLAEVGHRWLGRDGRAERGGDAPATQVFRHRLRQRARPARGDHECGPNAAVGQVVRESPHAAGAERQDARLRDEQVTVEVAHAIASRSTTTGCDGRDQGSPSSLGSFHWR